MENPLSKGVELESPGIMEDYNHMDVTRLRERIQELEVKTKGYKIRTSGYKKGLTRMGNCNLTNECSRKYPKKIFGLRYNNIFGDDDRYDDDEWT